jgi:hypothetical protein
MNLMDLNRITMKLRGHLQISQDLLDLELFLNGKSRAPSA